MHVQTRFAVVRPAVLAVVCLLAAATAAQAQWAWRDKSGQVTASDRPPPKDIPDKDILRRPADRRSVAPSTAAVPDATTTAAGTASAAASAPAAPAGPKSALEAQVEARKKAAEQEQAAKAKAEAEKTALAKAENCKRARNQIATLDSGERMARINDKGEREVLDDAARAEEGRRARGIVAADCK